MVAERTTIHPDDLLRLLGDDDEIRTRLRNLALMVIESTEEIMYSGGPMEVAKVRTVMLPALLKLLAGDEGKNAAETLRQEMRELMMGTHADQQPQGEK